ncbi:MAG: hypothetical protein M1839_000366 [Geoglossum umbratile]|nr:MAG: hypothetical protein M1839_000366 [Geoglossum umbratile]
MDGPGAHPSAPKGCKISVLIPSPDTARLQGGSRIKFEFRTYGEKGKEHNSKTEDKVYEHKFKEVSDQDVGTENEIRWYYMLQAQQVTKESHGNEAILGSDDIDYGQRWTLDGNMESNRANSSNDVAAPGRGFVFTNAFDNVELRLYLMPLSTSIFLGKFNKGDHVVIPEVVFRVTITSGKEKNIFEFDFRPKPPMGQGTQFTHTITHHPSTTVL